MAQQSIHLVIIDPQNDFCDLPESHLPKAPDGSRLAPSLPVPGAHADLLRVADLIERGGAGLSAITVTLDAHLRLDIAHPGFWRQGDGSSVGAFTPIAAADVRAGRYRPRDAAALPRVLAYIDALEAAGRYTHMVWPVHCEIGSWGQAVHADLRRAYNAWEEARGINVDKVLKGSNPWTEHFSAIQAEVPQADDPGTQANRVLLDRLRAADLVLICGEAGSHCVKATTEHIAADFPAGERSKLVLLTDCMSPVGGFEVQQAAFIDAMRAQGLRTATATTVLPVLQANAVT